MNRLRRSILAVAASSFVAGVAVSAAALYHPPIDRDLGPDPEYERRFVETFRPSSDQVQTLRFLLRLRNREEEKIRNRLLPQIEPELRRLAENVEVSLVEQVLTPLQRVEYERLLATGRREGS